jgi:hypothetical protein
MTRAEARQECLKAQALARQLGDEKSIAQIIREIRGSVRPAAAVNPRESLNGRSVRTTDNCLVSCIATLLDCDPARVPRPDAYFDRDGAGFDLYGYDQALARATGYRFKNLGANVPRDSCNWIAVMSTATTREDGESHAILCRGRQLLLDPGDIFRAFQPSMLEYGLELIAA